MAEFRPHIETLREAGIGFAIVGSGAPHFARGFQERMGLKDVRLYSDQGLASYAAAGMKRSVGALLHPASLAKGLVSIFKYPQTRVQGDGQQQGGVIIVKPDGTMPFHFRSRYAGDHANSATIVAEALKARG